MSTEANLYWLTRLDYITGAAFIVIMLSVALLVFNKVEGTIDNGFLSKVGKRLLIVLIVLSSLICIFVPRKKDAILIIAGGKAIDYVKQDTSLTKIPGQATAIISKYLDEQLNKK